MAAVMLGMVLYMAVCAAAVAIGHKAQKNVHSSGHSSMTSYSYVQAQQDKHDLNRFGLAQQFRRKYGSLGSFGLSFNSMGVIGAAVLFLGPAIQQGGPSTVAVGLPIAAFFALAVSATLAELSSAVPTSGGVYHWASAIGRRVWGWYAGWFQLAGSVAMTALFNGAFALALDAILSARLQYESEWWTIGLLAVAATASQAAIQHRGTAIIATVQIAGFWLQAAIAVSIIGGLAFLLWPGVYSPELLYAFRDGGLDGAVQPWPFLAGVLLLNKLFVGMDGAAHGSEETHDPRIRVPWAIFLSAAYSYIIGLVLFLFVVLLFPVWGGNGWTEVKEGVFLSAALHGAAGSPIIALAIACALWGSGFTTLGSCSRAIFCMARDQALPFSPVWSRVTAEAQSPRNAIWLAAALTYVLFIAVRLLTGENFAVVLNGFAMICTNIAYAIPIALLIKLQGRHRLLDDAPWRLGSWGMTIYKTAFVWLLATAVLAIAATGWEAAFGIVLLYAVASFANRKYGARHLAKLQSRLKRPRGEIIRMERKFDLH
ncbi:amino acid permease [Paenibacillus sp. NEAU-GSW1]|uniref:amino acid permease n=1 Tax=Paenibacillus sp. NEAU-GSW1 TaxID=2682486 RepID=UPI0015662885|nr:amino acid permease [Paenibacillus sp. NEAU-GSW1]